MAEVDGATIAVQLDPEVPSGLMFASGEAHAPGQVGSFVRVSIGFVDLIAIVTKAGSSSPEKREDGGSGRWLSAQLVGETAANRPFSRGVARLPSIGSEVFVVTNADLQSIYGTGEESKGWFRVGKLSAAGSIAARVDINRLVTRHSAVVGSTGSGKSTTVAAIIERIADSDRLPSARALIFDLHGEYARALSQSAHVLSASSSSTAEKLLVPFWALSFEELLQLTLGSNLDDSSRAYVRDEIVRLKQESVASFPVPGLAVEDVTVDTPVAFSLRRLWFELHLYLNATHTVAGTGQSPSTIAYELDGAGNIVAVGDAQKLIAPRFMPQTQASNAQKVFLSAAPLSMRRNVDVLLSRLRDPRYSFVLKPGPWDPDLAGKTTKDLGELIAGWVGSDRNVTVVQLAGVPQVAVLDIVGSMTRILYDALFWSRRLSEGGVERPLLLVFEEAHSYLGSESAGSAKAAVQRVVREGRKYGVGAMIVSQRPSEIDTTILSQCGTLIAMRLTNATDRQIIARAAADNLDGMFAVLPVLRTGEAVLVGEAVALPTRALIELPTSRPDSLDPVLVGDTIRPGGWDKPLEKSDYAAVARAWRAQSPESERIIP